jgi:hypothetical protein
MKTTTRIMTMACRAAIGAACLLGVAGCRQQASPGDSHGQASTGHVIPAHKPKTFPDAVLRLREMNDRISHGLREEQPGSSRDQKTLQMALDVANWLPEIAADSDMPEKPWNDVNTRSEALVADYEAILSAPPTNDPTGAVRDAGQVISDLETLLAAADPHWFAGPENYGQSD